MLLFELIFTFLFVFNSKQTPMYVTRAENRRFAAARTLLPPPPLAAAPPAPPAPAPAFPAPAPAAPAPAPDSNSKKHPATVPPDWWFFAFRNGPSQTPPKVCAHIFIHSCHLVNRHKRKSFLLFNQLPERFFTCARLPTPFLSATQLMWSQSLACCLLRNTNYTPPPPRPPLLNPHTVLSPACICTT